MAYGISKKITLENKRKNFLKFYPEKKKFFIQINIFNFRLLLSN